MIMSLFTVNFFNSGCLLYPVKLTCFDNFSWSIPVSEVEQMNNWYQQWAKAGANPNFRVENPELYIKNFNWVFIIDEFGLYNFGVCLSVFQQ